MRIPKINHSVLGWKREALMLIQRGMLERKVTLTAMAKVVGLRGNALSNWFGGDGGPKFEDFLKLARFLGASREEVDAVIYRGRYKFRSKLSA